MRRDRKDRRTLHNVLAVAVLVAVVAGVACVMHYTTTIFTVGVIALSVGVLVLFVLIVGVTDLLITSARRRRSVIQAQQKRTSA